MRNLFNNTYEGRTVLVTGHTGFKGSWLTLWLTQMGAKVVGYSIDVPTTPSHHELMETGAKSIFGDILDKEKLQKTIEEYQPEIIFHLAAQPIVRTSYLDPVNTIETNVMGTVNVLESARKVKSVKAVVCVTSDKCYHNKEHMWGYREEDALGGKDPYSASKGAAEIVAHSYLHSFFNPADYRVKHTTLIATVRAGNVIGGGDWGADRLIPDIVRAVEVGKKVSIRNPLSTRPWQHVLEPLSGYLAIGGKLFAGEAEFSGAWNFGPSDSANITVDEVLRISKMYWDKIDYQSETPKEQFHEANLLMLDSTKARRNLNWKNVWNHNDSIERTIKWYKNYTEEKGVSSKEDLKDYIHDAKKLSVNWAK